MRRAQRPALRTLPVTLPRALPLPYSAEVRVHGSGVDVYALGSHRDLTAAQTACRSNWRAMGPLAWQAGRPGTWVARAGANITFIITRKAGQ